MAKGAKTSKEIEIKFQVNDLKALARKLRAAGFHIRTRRTHEMNVLYDLPSGLLRKRGEVLRIRKYGQQWTVTHKTKGQAGRHKSRNETETQVTDGPALASIFESMGFIPAFRYEKFRTEWTDGIGHVVVDETPIGNIAEIEGSTRWIDQTAKKLDIAPADYSTKSYAQLFVDWKRQARSDAQEMTWAAIKGASR
jgi:adenylate cyclase class 2